MAKVYKRRSPAGWMYVIDGSPQYYPTRAAARRAAGGIQRKRKPGKGRRGDEGDIE